jgi:hypothetical protein
MSEQAQTVAGPFEDRDEPPGQGDERAVLVGWLEFHRTTLARKCAGLTDEQLRQRAVLPSPLSLVGLVRHMTEMERVYLRHGFGGEEISQLLFCTDDDPDGDFESLDDVPGSLATWHEHVAHCRQIVTAAPSLDTRSARWQQNLRWVLTKVIQEYARHNGHADLLREAIDGATGE